MIALSVIFGLYVIGSLILRYYEQKSAREERAELELSLMAFARPDAALTKQALTDPQPATINYQGEGDPYDFAKAAENGHEDLS